MLYFRVCWSLAWLSGKKLNDFHVYNKTDFFIQLFFSTVPFKTSDKVFWKCHESWDGYQNCCQDPISPGSKDRLCFGAQTWEHKPEPRSLQEITGYKLLPESKLRRTSVTSRKALSLGKLVQPKKTWGVCWHRWSWLWPWQCSAVVRKVRGRLPGRAPWSAAQSCSLPSASCQSGRDAQLRGEEVHCRSLHNFRSLSERQSHGWERAWG